MSAPCRARQAGCPAPWGAAVGQGHIVTGCHLPVPPHGAQTAPSSRCGSPACCQLPLACFLLPQRVTAAGDVPPLDGVPQRLGCGDKWLSPRAPVWLHEPQDCGQDAGVTWWRQSEGVSGEGAGDSPAVSPAPLCHQPRATGADPAGTEATPQRCPGRRCHPALLPPVPPSCSAVPGSALPPGPPQVSVTLGGSGGDGEGQGHLAGTPQCRIPRHSGCHGESLGPCSAAFPQCPH